MNLPAQYEPFEKHIRKVWGGQLENKNWWLQIILNEKDGEQLVIECVYSNFLECITEGFNALKKMFPNIVYK